MRIISKFKDIYDNYNTFDDTTNTFVRETKKEEYKTIDVIEKYYNPITMADYYSFVKDYNYKDIYNLVLGIYPKIYCFDVIHTRLPLRSIDEVQSKETLLKLIQEAKKYKGSGLFSISCHIKEHKGNILRKRWYNDEWIDTEKNILESQDVFKQAPIFFINNLGKPTITYNPSILDMGKRYDKLIEELDRKDPQWRTTIYDRIENWLYYSKAEKIGEPDNKTKIINAGFDLKTSFRNVKDNKKNK